MIPCQSLPASNTMNCAPGSMKYVFYLFFFSFLHTSLYGSGVGDSPWLSKGSQSGIVTGGCEEYLFLVALLEVGEQKKGGPVQRQKSLPPASPPFTCMLLLYTANLLPQIRLCVRSRKSPCNTLWDPRGWDPLGQWENCAALVL